MISSKLNILCIFEILKKYSDENHILNSNDIKRFLHNDYDLELDRKAIYRNISYLIEFGYDISVFDENKKGFYLRERTFENSEVIMLIDAIASSKFISNKETRELISKLLSHQTIYTQKSINELCVVKSNTKTLNRDVFYSIEVIQEAIKKNKKIAFTYCTYDLNKKLIARRQEKYVVNPYNIICANENYYLICNYDKYDNLSNYRMDFIRDIEILEESIKKICKSLEIEKYINSSVYMFGGEEKKVKLRCDNIILKDIIDKFGEKVVLKPEGNNQFIATLDINIKGIEFWIMQYSNYCEVINPLILRKRIKENLEKSALKYQ